MHSRCTSSLKQFSVNVMSDTSVHHKTATASSLSYSVRRMRNTAVLVKWIEDHQSNPYPTKAEKQYLAYYSGMNLTQLSTWFANARRRIKKIGMKTWLEGRSTFSLDYFPSPIQRPSDSFTGGNQLLFIQHACLIFLVKITVCSYSYDISFSILITSSGSEC